MACAGSGLKVLRKNCWNIRNKNARWSNPTEGWRTTCPECNKIVAVGPTSHAIQKHYLKSKAQKAKQASKKTQTKARLDLIYAELYELGLLGYPGLRPTTFVGITFNKLESTDELNVWIMGYIDGLSDGGHTMKIGAFKRWMTREGLTYQW